MKHGSVYQRHLKSCPRADDGSYLPHRCRGAWGYVLEYGRDASDRRLQTTKSGFPTKSAALAALRERVQVLGSGVNAQRLTVEQYLLGWLDGKNALKPATRNHYQDLMNLYLLPGLGHHQLLDLQAHHLDRFYASLKRGRRGHELSPATIRRIHAVLRSALNSAVKRRLIPNNPALHVELPPERPKRPEPWTAEQCRQFMDFAQDDEFARLYYVLLVTGMRRGEAIGLRWVDVDLDRSYLRVTQQIVDVRGHGVLGTPKTRRGHRTVPIDGQTVEVLRSQLAAQAGHRRQWGPAWHDTGLVFTKADGSALRPEFVTRHFQLLARKAKLPAIRLHDLRHTNATLALEAGVELKVVSERLGHSTTAITADIYTHVAPTVGQRAAERIGQIVPPPGVSSEKFPSETLARERETDIEEEV